MKDGVWKAIGWTGVALSALAILYAFADPVLAIFISFVAIPIGGLSGVGIHSTSKFGVTCILLCLLLVNVMSHYGVSTGFRVPSVSSVRDASVILLIPLTVSLGLMALGVVRRAKK